MDLFLAFLLGLKPLPADFSGMATCSPLYSGIYLDTGSSGLIRPSSIRIIVCHTDHRLGGGCHKENRVFGHGFRGLPFKNSMSL